MSSSEPRVVLRAESISKAYPGVRALIDADFDIVAGAVNVLVGENGAGKSTLMKIIAGVEPPTAGAIYMDGKPVHFANVADAARHGVGIVFQELNLFSNLSIAENIFATHEILRFGVDIDSAAQDKKAAEILALLRQPLDPRTLVEDLTIGQKQIVEIAKALARDARVLIFDEPTSALSIAETETLFEVIAALKARDVGIVYISHRMEELARIGDYGRIAGHAAMKDVDAAWIVARLLGANAKAEETAPRAPGRDLLRAIDVSLPSEKGGWKVEKVNLTIREREIVGVYGLLGAGRTEFLDCIMGRRPEAQGAIEIDGAPVRARDVAGRIRCGLALAPEDRRNEGLVHTLSIAENLTLASLNRYAAAHGIEQKREEAAVRGMIENLSIKVRDPTLPIGVLSGGNQQKVVIGKALLTQPKVLLMDEPTRGIDVGAKYEIYRLLRRLSADGLAVLFATSELEEAILLADRVAVMRAGRLVEIFDRAEATPEKILIAAGQKQAA